MSDVDESATPDQVRAAEKRAAAAKAAAEARGEWAETTESRSEAPKGRKTAAPEKS